VDIIAINDPFINLNCMVYMFQYDSTHGKFNVTVKAENGKLVINRKAIPIFQVMLVLSTSWSPLVSSLLWGRHEKYDNSLKIVRNVSCTINCIALLAKVTHDNFDIVEGLMTPIHAITATQKTVDGPSGKL
jgi:glyceraldehyde 3-phosphate dehydrogenase